MLQGSLKTLLHRAIAIATTLITLCILVGCVSSTKSMQPAVRNSNEVISGEVSVVSSYDEADFICNCGGTHDTIDVNGVTLHFAVAGEGKPVLLIHGNSGSHESLSTQIHQLADAGYKVYAVDSRGQGSNEALSEYHYADMAEDMYQFITALDIQGCALYGWSDGGIVGLELCLAHSDIVSLMAISGANLYVGGIDGEVISQIQATYESTKDPLVELMLAEPNMQTSDLSIITIPVLVTAGSDDMVLRSHTELIASSLPNSHLVIVDRADHGSYISGSDIMGNLLLAFFADYEY